MRRAESQISQAGQEYVQLSLTVQSGEEPRDHKLGEGKAMYFLVQ